MADARIMCRSVDEKASAFNKRLAAACSELPVTGFDLFVLDGQPVVTLLSEEVQATEENVAEDQQEREEAAAAGEKPDPDDEPLAVGDWIPAFDPVVVQVAKVNCATDDEAGKSEARCEDMYARAKGTIAKHAHAVGASHRWEQDPNSPENPKHDPRDPNSRKYTKLAYVPCQVGYVAISYLNDEGAEDAGDGKGEDPVARSLNRGKSPVAAPQD